MKHFSKHIALYIAALTILSCHDSLTDEQSGITNEEIKFSAVSSQVNMSRSLVSGYEALPVDYTLNIKMSYMNGTQDQTIATARYSATTVGSGNPSALAATQENGNIPLYWPGNAIEYGFTASAGTTTIPTNQDSYEKIIAADRLLGYGGTDDTHDIIAYWNAKTWKSLNNSKTIPIYMKHQCAMISIILKAGEGVNQNALQLANVGSTLTDTIYSYGTSNDKNVTISKPFAQETSINVNGNNIKTTKFKAIVEPYNYAANNTKTITRIVLNNQKFSFSASNDVTTANINDVYNLEAGEHLELTVVIARSGRIVNVFAKEKDWEIEKSTDIETDDFGFGTTPVLITSGEDDTDEEFEKSLLKFLAGEGNKKGNMAILNNDIILSSSSAALLYPLKALVNLNGHTIKTTHTLFSRIDSTGVIKNGNIEIKNNVDCVVADTNNGLIENITLNGADGVKANKAGFVVTNNKTIHLCTNNLNIYGNDEYIGGIAAIQNENASIVDCVCMAKVSAPDDNTTTILGGIVGKAANGSSVIGCTYDYGITITQNGGAVRMNIIGSVESGAIINAYNNAWPTLDNDNNAGTNIFNTPYTGVIDNENELALISVIGNINRYRIASNFNISSNWQASGYNMSASLDGNGKTIFTNGTSIFYTISGNISNLTITLKEKLTAIASASDAIASLALLLDGGTLNGIVATIPSETDRENIFIKSANPAGIVATAINNSTISQCRNNVSLLVYTTAQSGTIYAGGIVSQAKSLNISNCQTKSNVTIMTDSSVSGLTTYIGGIVGGIGWDEDKTAKTSVINDCSCFMKEGNASGSSIGGIVGYVSKTGIEVGNTSIGNWWQTKKGVGTIQEGASSIGVKNAITPIEL